MRKLIASLMFGIVTLCMGLIGLGMSSVAWATEVFPADMEPPVYHSITVTPAQVDVGDAVTVEVYATDNVSGVDTVTVTFRNHRVYEDLIVTPTRVGNSNIYRGEAVITPNLAKGRWDLAGITLYDRYGNYEDSVIGLPTCYFEVANPNPDFQAPELIGATVTLSSEGVIGTIGDTVRFEVDAKDDRGVQSVVFTICDNRGNQFYEVQTQQDANTGKWIGEFAIDEKTRSGRWVIASMTLIDTSWNKTELYPDAEQLVDFYFEVENPNNDISDPQVHSVDISPSLVKPGEKVKISVQAEDDKSGIENISVTITNPSPVREDYSDMNLAYNSSTDRWEGEIDLPFWAAEGEYQLTTLKAWDRFSNTFYGSEQEFPLAKFTVDSTTAIKLNPSKTTVQAGEEFNVEVGVVNVRNLHTAEMRISYDPTKLEVVDMDPAQEGIQVKIEGILDGLTLSNQVEDRLIIFNIAKADTQTFSGSGTLATIKFRALNDGNFNTNLDFEEAYLYSYDPLMPQPISFTQHGSEITVLGAGTVKGKVMLQGLTSYAGAKISLAGTDIDTVTDEQGNFTLPQMTGGQYTLIIQGPDHKPVFLVAGKAINVVNGQETKLDPIILSTGDISGDNAVSLLDLTSLAIAYDSKTGQSKWNANADLNDDGKVGVIDLSLLASNWTKVGFSQEPQ